MIEMDSIILGHNQFMGVNHLSQQAARDKAVHLNGLHSSIEMIRFSANSGVKALMVSSHPTMKEILEHMRGDGLSDLNLYLIIPSAQEYVRQFSEKGALGLLNEMLAPAGVLAKSKILMKGGLGVLKKNAFDLLGTLIDIEMLPFKGFPVKAVFLHNVLTDLALGLGNRDIFEFWVEYVRKNYNAVPAFATMNYARLAKNLNEWGIHDTVVMASFNKVGFQMNPSKEECERCLKEYDVPVLAMSTLASGALNPKEAYEYLFSLPNINSVVVGASTQEHAEETFRIINEYKR
ncbi:MAG: hypothetical protein GY861_13025 [bacterium]|nr:hypothetical protein [bacterium]